MKPARILLLILTLATLSLKAQERSERFQKSMEEMQTERVSFLTAKLELTVDEAQKFWPLYNEYLKKREELIFGRRERFDRKFDPEKVTDEDMKKMLEEMLDQEIKLAQLKKEYYTRIEEILPIRKVLRLQRTEQEFMNHMLNRLRDGGRKGDTKSPDRQPFKIPQGGGY